MTERFIRDALLKSKWSRGDLEELTVIYISRGSPDNRSEFKGSEIEHIGKSFVELSEGTKIPFHRMIEIQRGTETIWSRDANR